MFCYIIISYYIISYHNISYHIISYHMISYHMISYHIISYYIISYYIISYHIILSYIILCIFIYYVHIYVCTHPFQDDLKPCLKRSAGWSPVGPVGGQVGAPPRWALPRPRFHMGRSMGKRWEKWGKPWINGGFIAGKHVQVIYKWVGKSLWNGNIKNGGFPMGISRDLTLKKWTLNGKKHMLDILDFQWEYHGNI